MNLLSRIKSMFRPALTCADANAFIAEYIDDALDQKTRKSFKKHVEMCPNCSVFLEQYNSTIDLCRNDGKVAAPPELVETTLEFLRSRGVGEA